MLTLYQAEWCPFSSAVREILTELGLDFVARHNAEKYTAKPVDFKEFSGRPHFPGAPGWEEVADYALDWAAANATSAVPAGQAH